MVYKSSVYVCVFWILLQKLILSIFATFFCCFCFFSGLLWESACCVEGGGKPVHKASATQRRDMHQFPLHPLQLHRSHNLACPLRLMIAEPVSPFSFSLSLPPSAILAPTVFSTPLHHCWAHIPHSLFCELCFPFFVDMSVFSELLALLFSKFLHPEKSPEVIWLQDGTENARETTHSNTPPPTPPPHWSSFGAHTDNSPPSISVIVLSSDISLTLPQCAWVCSWLQRLGQRSCCALSQINNSLHM